MVAQPQEAATVGTSLPRAPAVAPGRAEAVPKDPLAVANARYQDGDLHGVVTTLTPWLEKRRPPWGKRERTAGHLLLGVAHMGLENWNLASRHFYRVRRTETPLAAYGAWYEALVDHKRGRHLVAVKECKSYRETWPEGAKAEECLLLIGDAYAAQGYRSSSVEAYKEFLSRHPDTPREEEIKLAIALAIARTAPRTGISLLRDLALVHRYPSTDLAVKAALAELKEDGHDVALPETASARMQRCASLRRSGLLVEAWELFQKIAEDAETDPTIAAWVHENEDSYAWGTRQFAVYAENLAEEYAESPSAELAWRIFRALSRDGDWDKALVWGEKGLSDHASDWRWRGAKDDMAWAAMLAGNYTDAAERWGALTRRIGRRAIFYQGFCQLQAGEPAAAVETLSKLAERRHSWALPALYWRSRANTAAENTEAAEADRQAVYERDDEGWYTILLNQYAEQPAGPTRSGRWSGDATPAKPDGARSMFTPTIAARRLLRSPDPTLEGGAAHPGWSSLTWDQLMTAAVPVESAESALSAPTRSLEVSVSRSALPDGYVPSAWYDPSETEDDFRRFAERNTTLWPTLQAAHDLANAGLYDESARLVYAVHAEWRTAVRAEKPDERQEQIRALGMTPRQWRAFILFTRDHYHAARACSGLGKSSPPPERLAAERLAYPIVRGAEIWEHSRRYDVDPFLMLGIMRQESTYRNKALSPVGAIGLVQVMPSTGAKIAALLDEHRYSPRQLEDPGTNVRYGTYYFSKLLDRFDGVFPLAVASYNGGPHNMSRWYRPHHGEEIALDVMVEQIQYDETRDYVKRVTGHYARYVELYTDEVVKIPDRPLGDDRTVIDF